MALSDISLSGIGDFFSGIGNSIGNIFGGSPSSSDLTSSNVSVPDSSSTPTLPDTMTNMTYGISNIPLSYTPDQTGISTNTYNLGGQAASPAINNFLNGSTSSSTTPFSALAPGGENQGQGPTSAAASALQGSQPSGASNDILQALGFGTGSGALDKTLLTAGVSGGGLLANLLTGGGSTSAEKSLKSIAGAQSAQSQQLENYLASGTLPPGAQEWVNAQTAANQAQIRAQYAQQGLSGSSMEQEALSDAADNATQQMFQIASSLLNSGISETNASGTLYNYLMQAQNADQKQVSDAIQNFVSSLAGGGNPNSVTLQLAGKT